MGSIPADRPVGAFDLRIDVPRTILNVAAIIALALSVMVAIIRAIAGDPPSFLSAYVSVAAIELAWLTGQAIILSHRG